MARDILHGQDASSRHALLGTEALDRARQVEVEARPVLRRDRPQPGQRSPAVDHTEGLGHRIGDRPPALGGGEVEAVGDRAAPVRPGIESGQAVLDAEEAADVAGVAVGIPSRRGGDSHRAPEIVAAVEEAEDDQGVIRHHVAIAGVAVVAVARGDPLARPSPVRLARVPLADVVDQAADDRVGRDESDAEIEERAQVGLREGRRFHRRQHLGTVDRRAVVADRGGAAGEVGGARRVAGRDHRPAVDEDLRADLLGDDRAVECDRTAGGGGRAGLQAQIGGVLGRVAEAAPPEDRAPLDDVVQPALADLRGSEIRGVATIGEGTEEGEGAGDVVVGDDQRRAKPLVDVVGHLA